MNVVTLGIICSSLLGIVFSLFLILWLRRLPVGTEKMREIFISIQEGATSYLYQQYRVVVIFFIVVFLLLLIMAANGLLTFFEPFAFLSGGILSALCGWVGMYISTHSNARTAVAAAKSLNQGLRVAFSSGMVMGLMVVSFGLLGLFSWFLFLRWPTLRAFFPERADALSVVTQVLLCYGMGASSYALFARVGGGIYTKAADVGADLVGKVELGIPEDDPRNPAVIADLVGDNVGDVAGMGADLYESYVDSLIAAMALAVIAGLGIKGVFLPMLVAAAGIIASCLGFFFVRTDKGSQKDLIFAVRKGVLSSAFFILLMAGMIMYFYFRENFLGLWAALAIGLFAGSLLGFTTEFFTSSAFPPAQNIARSSLTGSATLIISGLSIGMLSTAFPVLLVSLAVFFSFSVSGGFSHYQLGLYGIGLTAVGLLCTLGITLASDAYGPVADNAGGIAQMARMDEKVRTRTDQLDTLGNTTAATGKGFAIGSAALTALALIVTYKERMDVLGEPLTLSLLDVRLMVGLFIGGVLPFIFSALTLRAVGKAAESIVQEVRRQFSEMKGILEGKTRADYSTCVKITTQAAQKNMFFPAFLAIIVPLVTGLVLGSEAVVGLLVGSLVSGFVLAVMMANTGGAWDNAKKFIEEGNFGGKGSSAHKAAVVGDTVGDPLKDTAGPALNILLKLISIVSIVFSQFIVTHSLFK